jgi:hypothetical protein
VRPEILAIANAYLGMWTRMTQLDLRKTLALGNEHIPTQSQKWHRDPEEKRMLKCFIYLSDVVGDAGPFTYARKSTYGNRYGSLFPQRPPEGSYPLEDDVRRMIPAADITPMTGSAGTVIFCDTSGLHFGGRARSKERIMFTSSYNSSAFTEGARYIMPDGLRDDIGRLPAEVQFALSAHRIKSAPL